MSINKDWGQVRTVTTYYYQNDNNLRLNSSTISKYEAESIVTRLYNVPKHYQISKYKGCIDLKNSPNQY